MLEIPFNLVRAVWRMVTKRFTEKTEEQRKFDVALAYNKLHTFAGPDLNAGAWCCPTCNKVHACVAHSVFTGRQFPACCEFEAGHRLHSQHATGLNG